METLSNPEQEPKLQWNQPKLVELDVNSTEGGVSSSPEMLDGFLS